jgi:hypothetical protein
MHRDIYAILGDYSRNLREFTALFCYNIAIISAGFRCDILIDTYIQKYNFSKNKYIYTYGRFYLYTSYTNNYHIMKNIYYDMGVYWCKDHMCYGPSEIFINDKYHIHNDKTYKHFFGNNLVIIMIMMNNSYTYIIRDRIPNQYRYKIYAMKQGIICNIINDKITSAITHNLSRFK